MSRHDFRTPHSPIRPKAIEIANPYPQAPPRPAAATLCQDMAPIKPLALRLALSGLIIKRFAHLIASVYRPLRSEPANEFPFAAGHVGKCRVCVVLSSYVLVVVR